MTLKTLIDLEELINDSNLIAMYVDYINNIEVYEQLKQLIAEQKDAYKLFKEILYFQKKYVDRTLSITTGLHFYDFYNPDCPENKRNYELIVRYALENYDKFEQKTIKQKQILDALLEIQKKVCEKWHFEP
uniref:Uncharacterized protein n=1 Tax=Thuricola similis TaxID=2784598 RepID=A0A7T8G5D3_9CILI|nr:hypothetical protein K4Z05_mgp35 [Thuricola similis]QQP22128.1 hypothetical protein TSIM_14 [Thuricola similis]